MKKIYKFKKGDKVYINDPNWTGSEDGEITHDFSGASDDPVSIRGTKKGIKISIDLAALYLTKS
jgi:hypothetical protein